METKILLPPGERDSRRSIVFVFCLAMALACGRGQVQAGPAYALQFDGANDYVTFGAAPALSLSNFTLEVWFKRTGAGTGTATGGGGIPDAVPLLDKGRSEADGDNRDMNYILAIRASDSRLVADFEEGAAGSSPGLNHPVAGVTVLTNNGWYHAAATYDGSQWRLFLNGALEANLFVGQPVRSDSIQHAALATAMDSSGLAAGFFQGVLDEARIWNYARSTTEISNNFRTQIVSAPGLVGRWGLNEGAGVSATNSGSSGVNGTLMNGPAWVTGYPFEPAPTASITQPAAGASFTGPLDLLIQVAVSSGEGSVTNLEVLEGANKLGEDSTSPFSIVWSNAPLGNYALIAIAKDDRGFATTSAVVNITITTSSPPTVTLSSPADGASFPSGANVTLTASASDNSAVSRVDFFLAGEKFRTDTNAPYSVVWSNAALGLWPVTAVATDNEGLATTSAPVYVTITNSPSNSNTLVSQGMPWRYLDNGSDQGTAWRAPGFNDSSWPVGAAQLGYGDGDEITVVSDGGNPTNRYITTYFRRSFEVANAAAHAQLTVRLLRDDGAVVYLNGNEVFRSNMPGGAITSGTLASTAIGGSEESTFFSALVDATNLVTGANVLAVEVHQAAVNSSDISFDLQLLSAANSSGSVLTRGPYLQTGTTNSVIVRWRTDVAGNSVVRCGTNATNLDRTITDATATTEHIVTVTNLAADTKYFYAIVAGANTLAGGTNYFFVTAPPIGPPKPTRLWVIGDSGTANANSRAVRDAYLSFATTNLPANLWLMLGDNAYNSGLDAEYQAAVFDMYPTLLRNTVLWSTIGNHETAQETSISTFPYLDIFSLPPNAEAGGVASGTERYYSFDYANIHFVCLDAMTSSRATNGAMANWLGDDLSTSTQEWMIAFWHHPPYTKGSHDSDAESQLIEMRQNIVPILESYGVDLVLCGHSHAYERSFLLKGHYGSSGTLTSAMKLNNGDGQEDGDGAYLKTPSGFGANYIVAGNGGQISGGSLNHPAMFLSLNELGSLVIDISTNRLDVRMLGTTSVRDHYTVIKQGPPAPSFDRFAQQGFKARRGEFLTNGYAVLTGVTSPSVAGAGVSVSGDWVFYAPPASFTNSDTFGFTATDRYGGSVLASSAVNIAVDNAPSQNAIVDDLGNGSFRLRFSGIPSRAYSIQYSNDVNNPAWTTLATSTANSSGVFQFVDTPPAGVPRFYRSTQP